MILEEVVLENFISHRRTVVRFGPGVTLIVGPNGAGKTSIVDAITYSLFGIHSRGQPQAREPVIRLGASVARVKLVFRVGGRRYMIVKTIPRSGTGETKLYMVDENKQVILADGAVKVKSEISRLLGAHTDVLKHLLVARQGEIDLVVKSSEERKKLVNAVLQLDAMEKAYERMSTLISRWREKLAQVSTRLRDVERMVTELRSKRERLREYEKTLARLKDALEERAARLREVEARVKELEQNIERLKLVESRITFLEEQLETLTRRREELEETIQDKEDRLRRLEELEKLEEVIDLLKEYASLLREREEVAARLENAERMLRELGGVDAKAARLENLAKRYEEVLRRLEKLQQSRRKYDELVTRVEQLRRRLEEIENEAIRARRKAYREIASILGLERLADREPDEVYNSLRSLIERVDELLEENSRRLEKLRERLGEVRSRISDATSKIEALSRAYGRCPLCGQPLSVERREKLIKNLRQERDKLRSEEKTLIEKLRETEETIRELKGMRERVSKALSTAESLKRYVEQLSMERERIKAEIKELEDKVKSLWLEVNEYEELEKELEKLSKAVEEYRRAARLADELARARAEAEYMARKLSEIDSRLKELRASLEGYVAAELLEDPEKALELVEDVVRARAERETLLESLRELYRELDDVKKRIDEIRAELRQLYRDREALGKAVEEYNRLVEEKSRLEKEVKDIETRISYITGQLDTLREDVEKLPLLEKEAEALKARRKVIQNTVQVLETIRRLFGPTGLQRALRARARELLEYHLRLVLQRFGLDVDDVRITDDFDIVIVSRNGEKRISMLSGGERVALGIAFRIALARLAGSRIGVMVLDEPTANLDEERRRELVEIIKYGLSDTGLQQLIVISHDRELEDAADTVIEVYRDSSGASAVRIVEPRPVRAEVV